MADKCYRLVWSGGRGQPLKRMKEFDVNMFDVRNELGITFLRTKIETRALERTICFSNSVALNITLFQKLIQIHQI